MKFNQTLTKLIALILIFEVTAAPISRPAPTQASLRAIAIGAFALSLRAADACTNPKSAESFATTLGIDPSTAHDITATALARTHGASGSHPCTLRSTHPLEANWHQTQIPDLLELVESQADLNEETNPGPTREEIQERLYKDLQEKYPHFLAENSTFAFKDVATRCIQKFVPHDSVVHPAESDHFLAKYKKPSWEALKESFLHSSIRTFIDSFTVKDSKWLENLGFDLSGEKTALIAALKEFQSDAGLTPHESVELVRCATQNIIHYDPVVADALAARRPAIFNDSTRFASLVQLLKLREGICTEFSKIAVKLGRELGLRVIPTIGQGEEGVHSYNSVQLDGTWYHFEPQTRGDYLTPTQNYNHNVFFMEHELEPSLQLLGGAILEFFTMAMYVDYLISGMQYGLLGVKSLHRKFRPILPPGPHPILPDGQ